MPSVFCSPSHHKPELRDNQLEKSNQESQANTSASWLGMCTLEDSASEKHKPTQTNSTVSGSGFSVRIPFTFRLGKWKMALSNYCLPSLNSLSLIAAMGQKLNEQMMPGKLCKHMEMEITISDLRKKKLFSDLYSRGGGCLLGHGRLFKEIRYA